MCSNVKLFLYTFDFIGIVPQFRILKYNMYKSIFSSIISIIITISFIGFSIYSIIDYLKFKNPSISYLKGYDNTSNHTILLNDTLFMFRAYRINYDFYETDMKFEAYYFNEFDIIELNIERCQLGKNINIKFKDGLEKLNDNINDSYCISSEHGNLPLFSNPGLNKKAKSFINIFILNNNDNNNTNNENNNENNDNDEDNDENNDTYLDDYINVELITENDIIDHDNKKDPIIPSFYFYGGMFDSKQYFNIDYRFEFIKYETDDGYFFNRYKNFTAIGMSEISLKNDYISSALVEIIFQQSEKNYPHYKRSYKKVQSLLADIMSIINILIGVGKAISKILLQKKMNKDIIRSLLNRNINNEITEHSLIESNRRKKKLFNNIINSERKDININIIEKSKNRYNSNKLFNFSKNDIFIEENANRKKIMKIQILKRINLCDIIKSYFWSKDKKSNLINICNNFVMKDLCVESILGRLYKLEKIFNLLSKEELSKLNLYTDKKFSKISKNINEIYIEIMKNNNNKNSKKANFEMIDKNKDDNILNK